MTDGELVGFGGTEQRIEMRQPIQRQLLMPMLAVMILSSAATAILAAWLGTRAVRQAEQERLQQLAGTLTDAGFPLTNAVLQRMSDLSGAGFVTLDHRGAIQHASLSLTDADRQQLDALPSSTGRIKLSDSQPVNLSAGNFRAVRIPLRTTATPQTAFLVILTPEERWSYLASRAALAPLVAGLIAATIAAIFAAILARRFVGRIHSLADRAALLAEGTFDSRPLPRIDDELRDLAVAMNTAAEKLKRYESQVRHGERLQTLGRLGAGMAHQLRNAITGARMALDLHAVELPTESDRESLAVATRQLTLMETYLQRFLTLGRGEAPKTKAVNLSELVREALELVEPMCRHHQIVVSWSPPETVAEICGDAEALRQLLLNLLINAIEAVQPLAVMQRTIALNLESRSSAILLRIWDAGPGPSPEISPRLFEPFITDKPDGTGLGLAVAQEIAVQHGGKIGCFREGGRTCFELALTHNTDGDLRTTRYV